MRNVYALGIIGCGLTGTSMFYQLVYEIKKQRQRQATAYKKMSVIIFEKSGDLGPGLPYAAKNVFPYHVSNMPASDMSIVPDRPDDFIDWFNTQRHAKTMDAAEFGSIMPETLCDQPERQCLPRSAMGQYLKDRFREALNQAQRLGVVVSVQSMSEVTNIHNQGDVLSIEVIDKRTKNKITFDAERILLATGHWERNGGKKGYYPSPWPASRLLDQIPLATRTGVLGTSLSSIDTALTLFSDGTFQRDEKNKLSFQPGKRTRQVTLYSRNGLLPKVRGQIGSYRNRYFIEENLNALIQRKKDHLKLEDVFGLLDSELAHAYKKKIAWRQILTPETSPFLALKADIHHAEHGDNKDGDVLWQTILFQAIPLLKKAYLNLNTIQRLRFEKQFKSIFMAYAAVIPIVNAWKIYAFMKAGVLNIQKLGNDYQLKAASDPYSYTICYQDETGNTRSERLHFVINATGQSGAYRTNRSTLAQNILSSGLAQVEEFDMGRERNASQNHSISTGSTETGGLWIDPETQGIVRVKKTGRTVVSKRIFAVGIMTRGQVLNASMGYECALSARKVVRAMLKEIQ